MTLNGVMAVILRYFTDIDSFRASVTWLCTLAQPGEYDSTVRVRRRCALFVKSLWPLVLIL